MPDTPLTRAEALAIREAAETAWLDDRRCYHAVAYAWAVNCPTCRSSARQYAAREYPLPTVTRARVVKALAGMRYRRHLELPERMQMLMPYGWSDSEITVSDIMALASTLTDEQLDAVRPDRGSGGDR